jgi:hypothetical protein
VTQARLCLRDPGAVVEIAERGPNRERLKGELDAMLVALRNVETQPLFEDPLLPAARDWPAPAVDRRESWFLV